MESILTRMRLVVSDRRTLPGDAATTQPTESPSRRGASSKPSRTPSFYAGLFDRMLLKLVDASDGYIDYRTPNFPNPTPYRCADRTGLLVRRFRPTPPGRVDGRKINRYSRRESSIDAFGLGPIKRHVHRRSRRRLRPELRICDGLPRRKIGFFCTQNSPSRQNRLSLRARTPPLSP
jgi:hypothetical protein